MPYTHTPIIELLICQSMICRWPISVLHGGDTILRINALEVFRPIINWLQLAAAVEDCCLVIKSQKKTGTFACDFRAHFIDYFAGLFKYDVSIM